MAGSSGTGTIRTPAISHEQSPSPGSDTTTETVTKFVERRTGLRGQGIAPGRVPARTIRKNTEDDLNEKVPEIPYVKAERAIRDLVCSLMERQDRMNEEILERVIDLQYRMDDLEGDRSVPKRKKMPAAWRLQHERDGQ